MGKKTIVVNVLSPSSLKAAQQQLVAFQRRFEERKSLFLLRLAEIGVETAREKFTAALAQYDGNQTPIEVDYAIEGNTVVITANGDTVAFLEFGAGVTHKAYSMQVPPGISDRGEYDKGYGKRKQWGFYPDGDPKQKAVLTTGNDPAEAMTGALTKIAEVCADIAREVFGSD